MLLEEGGEIDGNPGQAALGRRSARRHHQFPPRSPAFRDLDRGRGAERPAAGARSRQGLVYQPITDESFWAEKGRGAWLHERACGFRPARPGRRLIGTGIPFLGHGDIAQWAKIYRLSGRKWPAFAGSARLRSISPGSPPDGSTASGKAISTLGTPPPASLLVREAGGFVTDYRGADQML